MACPVWGCPGLLGFALSACKGFVHVMICGLALCWGQAAAAAAACTSGGAKKSWMSCPVLGEALPCAWGTQLLQRKLEQHERALREGVPWLCWGVALLVCKGVAVWVTRTMPCAGTACSFARAQIPTLRFPTCRFPQRAIMTARSPAHLY